MEYKLEDVTEYSNKKIEIDKINCNNYVSTENMLPNKLGIVSASSIPKQNKVCYFEKDSILISNIRPYFKKIWFTSCDGGCSNDVLNIKVSDTSKVIPKFLYYVLLQDEFFDYIMSGNKGTKMPRGDKKHIMNYTINLPNIETQIKIINILENLDKKIELNNQINDNLQMLINNLFTKYFVNFDTYNGNYKESDLGIIPETFEVSSLGNVVSFSNGYGWNSKDMLDNHIDNSYKVFKMGNINIGGGINKSKTKSWILKDKVVNLDQYISKKGDILMCMTDMKNSGNPLLGHTALIDKDDEFVINQRVGILRCDKDIGFSYVYTMSNMPDFISEIRSKANSGVQVNLTTKGICDTLVLVPDRDTLSRFENIAIPLYEQIFNNNNENESLEQLRDTLLPKLMNGKIDLDKIET